MPKITKIYGAPGTGKTTDMLRRLEEELKAGTKLSRIAFVTHTVAARNEARQRAMKLLPSAASRDFRFFKTIHGICYGQLHLGRDNVMQGEDYVRFGEYSSVPFSAEFSDELDEDGLPLGFIHSDGNEILAIHQLASAWCLSPFHPDIMYQWPGALAVDLVKDTLDKYKRFKTENAKFDFVDMLELYLSDKFPPLPIDVMFIDEAQDLSRKQWQVVHKMMSEASRVYIAGDDDQAIYGFIGADPQGFFRHNCDEEVVLPRTYRLPSRIWGFAQRIIGQVTERRAKQISVREPGGEVDYWNDPFEYLEFGKSNTMLIARHHRQLSGVARHLDSIGVPFTHRGRTVCGTPHARAIHAYFGARQGKQVPIKLAAQLCSLAGEHAKAELLRNKARLTPDEQVKLDLDYGRDWVNYLARTKQDKVKNETLRTIMNQRGLDAIAERPNLDLTTYHASKGREADEVILFTSCYRSAWEHAQVHPDDERRLAFVGVTRARKKVTIVAPRSNMYMRTLIDA